MVTLESIDAVKHDLEKAKAQLRDVDENIRRITGRDPTDDWFRRGNDGTNWSKNESRQPEGTNSVHIEETLDKQKEGDDDLNVSIASSVVQVAETRKRADASKDLKKSDKERGRRMLGILQGTLNQFRAESLAATTQPQMTKRREIDAKLEAKALEERQRLKRERGDLFRSRRMQQIEVNMLHRKMKLIREFDHWKENVLKMKEFCRTTHEPVIYYRPLVHNKESKRRLAETARAIDEMISERQRKLEAYFEDLEKQRRQFAATTNANNTNTNQFHDISDQDDEEGDTHLQGSRQSNGEEVALLPSSVGNLYRQVQQESSDWPPTTLSSTTTTVKKRMRRDSSSSGASEALAMEGDEEPVLMDEDHVVGNPPPDVVDTESALDTRTVRVNQSKLVPV